MDTLAELATWLSLNPWLTILSFLLTLLSVILAIAFFIRSKRAKEPRFAIRSFNLVRDFVGRLEALEMLYAGQRIGNLTVTKIAFWNNGAETMNQEDIASADPLVAKLKEEYTILDASVLFMKNDANQFSIDVSEDGSQLLLTFDYLDKDEGAVIQILHTGKSSKDVELSGTIKGGGKPFQQHVPRLRSLDILLRTLPPPLLSRARRRHLMRLVGISFILLPVALLAGILLLPDMKTSERAVSLGVCGLFGLGYWSMAFDILRRRIPPGFEVFEEEL